MTDQKIDPALHEARVDLLTRLASVSRDNGTSYDAHAFLSARAVFGETVTVEAWRSWGGIAKRSLLDEIEPGQGWFTDLDRQRERATSLRDNIRANRESAQRYRTAADEYRAAGSAGYARDYDGYAVYADQEADRYQATLDSLIAANPLLADPSDSRKEPTPLPPEQATTDAEDEDEHEHETDGNTPSCEECGGMPDHWCSHDHDCQNCDQCSHEHDCQHCGLDPDCDHRFTYTCDCGTSGVEYDG
jgi:hypothetical protein